MDEAPIRSLTVATSIGLCNRLRVLLSGLARAEATVDFGGKGLRPPQEMGIKHHQHAVGQQQGFLDVVCHIEYHRALTFP